MYRKMRKYTKSVEQYKRERARRKRVLELFEKGYAQKDVAVQLGVSTKTVGRDLKKLLPYMSAEITRSRIRLEETLDNALKLLPVGKRFEFMTARALSLTL